MISFFSGRLILFVMLNLCCVLLIVLILNQHSFGTTNINIQSDLYKVN